LIKRKGKKRIERGKANHSYILHKRGSLSSYVYDDFIQIPSRYLTIKYVSQYFNQCIYPSVYDGNAEISDISS
jgi:hypothetical protein